MPTFHSLAFAQIGKRTMAGEAPDAIAGAVLDLLEVIEDLLGERLLTYAVGKD